MSENTVKIGSRREVCWDGFLLDRGLQNGVSLSDADLHSFRFAPEDII